MLVLRLSRVGKRHQPHYRLVVKERRSKLSGKQVDYLGWYNPRSKEYRFNKERVLYWLAHGAQKTDTVHNLLIRAGIITGSKIAVHKKPKVDQKEKEAKASMDENMNQVPAQPEEGSQVEEQNTADSSVNQPEQSAQENVQETQPEASPENQQEHQAAPNVPSGEESSQTTESTEQSSAVEENSADNEPSHQDTQEEVSAPAEEPSQDNNDDQQQSAS